MKRAAFTIMVCLLLGAIVNVAVAWWLASRPYSWWSSSDDSHPKVFRVSSSGVLDTVVRRARGRIETVQWNPGLMMYQPESAISVSPEEFQDLLPRGSALSNGDVIDASRSSSGRGFIEVFSGWPTLALTGRLNIRDLDGGDKAFERDGMLGVPEKLRTYGLPGYLPVHPLWPGFAINTLFYGGVIALILWAPAWLRRFYRFRKGCCTACGYDLRGAAHARCPECGTRPAGAAAATAVATGSPTTGA